MMGAKPRNLKRAAALLLADFRPLIGTFIFVIIILLISSTLSVLMPILLGNFVNDFINLAVIVGGAYQILWTEVLKSVLIMLSFLEYKI